MIGQTVKYESGYGVFEGVVVDELEDGYMVESDGSQFYLHKNDVIKEET